MANFLGLGKAWDHTFGNKGAGGFLFGHGPQALVPKDMAGLRQQNIDMLMNFLKPGAFDAGGKGNAFFYGAGPNGVNNFLNADSPESKAYMQSLGVLQGMLTGTGPQFEQDISMANAQGGRFGSANAILRGEALRNLFNKRTETVGAIGALTGQHFSQLQDVQNQRLQLLAGLFGLSQNATNFPVENDKGAFGDILKVGASWLGGRGGGGGSNAAMRSTKMPQLQANNPFWGNV